MPGQDMFKRDMIFNPTSIVYWHILTARKQGKFSIDNVCKKSRQVRNDYVIGNTVYAKKTGVYRKVDYKKQGTYRIIEIFTNGTFGVHRGLINE